MKNSSCGLAVLKNSTTASLARSILLLMLPLMSKITPSETGASSLENVLISCGALALEELKIVFIQPGHQPVHGIGDGHRHQHQIDIHFKWSDMGIQCRRDQVLFGKMLGWIVLGDFSRHDVNVVHLVCAKRACQ